MSAIQDNATLFAGTIREILDEVVERVCQATLVDDPSEATGRALAGERVALLLDARCTCGSFCVGDPGVTTAHVAYLTRETLGAPAPETPVLVAATAQSLAETAVVAHRVTETLGRGVGCLVDLPLDEGVHVVRIPAPNGTAPTVSLLRRATDSPDLDRTLRDSLEGSMPGLRLVVHDEATREGPADAVDRTAATADAPFLLAVAPGGPPARRLLLDLAAGLQGAATRPLFEGHLAPGVAALTLGNGEAPPAIDLLYVAAPDLVPADETLDRVREGGAIVIGSGDATNGTAIGDSRLQRVASRGVALHTIDLRTVDGGAAALATAFRDAVGPEKFPFCVAERHVDRGRTPLAAVPRRAAVSFVPEDPDTPPAEDADVSPLSDSAGGVGLPVRLYAHALEDAGRGNVRSLIDAAGELARELGHRLTLDDRHTDGQEAESGLTAQLGAAGARFFEPGLLAERSNRAHDGGQLPAALRASMEATRNILLRFATADDRDVRAVVFHQPGEVLPAIDGIRAIAHPRPLSAARGHADGRLRRFAAAIQALHLARTLVRGTFDPLQHADLLGPVDPEAMTADEWRSMPAVLAVERAGVVREEGPAALSRLLSSRGTVHAILVDDPSALLAAGVRDGSRTYDPGDLAIGLRAAVVVETTLARPAHALEGLRLLARSDRPGLVVMTTPGDVTGSAASLLLEAALRARLTICLGYVASSEDDGGPRLDLAGNPSPETDWTDGRLGSVGDTDAPRESVTPAHVASLIPRLGDHIGPLNETAGAPEPIAVADLAAATGDDVPHGVPFLWTIDEEGDPRRAAVSPELASVCHERLRRWRALRRMATQATPRVAPNAPDTGAHDAPPTPDDRVDAARREALRRGVERIVAALAAPAGPDEN